jgi:tRNA 2-thiouridine synthesizing protein A
MDDDAGAAHEALDLRGLKCPLPALLTRRALRRLPPGAVVAVLCTDPLAGVDIPNLVRETGDVLVAAERASTGWRFVIHRA